MEFKIPSSAFARVSTARLADYLEDSGRTEYAYRVRCGFEKRGKVLIDVLRSLASRVCSPGSVYACGQDFVVSGVRDSRRLSQLEATVREFLDT